MEIRDTYGNALRRVITKDELNLDEWTASYELKVPSGTFEPVYTWKFFGIHLGYPRPESFQFRDGLLDVVEISHPSGFRQFSQFAKREDKWEYKKNLPLNADYNPNYRMTDVDWLGPGKFRITIINKPKAPDQLWMPAVIEVLDEKIPGSWVNAALKDGKPYNFQGNLKALALQYAEAHPKDTLPANLVPAKQPASSEEAKKPSSPPIQANEFDRSWIIWLVVTAGAVGGLLFLMRKPAR